MQKWEYTQITLRRPSGRWMVWVPGKDQPLKDQAVWNYLNQVGQQGWELVNTNQEGESFYLWFKRLLQG